jgi:sulfite exporter TauE/SafE
MDPTPCCGLDPTEPLTGAMLLGAGLAQSLGHCVGMCGPIQTAFSLSCRRGGSSHGFLAVSLSLYHGGRLTSYVTLGVLFALVGTLGGASSSTQWVRAGVSIGIGALMLILGIGLLDLLPTRRWIESSDLAGAVADRIRRLLATRNRFGQYGLGVANGFLPCGPVVVTALAAASTGSPARGAFTMLLFGVGTLPALALLGMGVGTLGTRLRLRLTQIGAVLLLLIGVQLGLRGAAALGWIPHLRLGPAVIW